MYTSCPYSSMGFSFYFEREIQCASQIHAFGPLLSVDTDARRGLTVGPSHSSGFGASPDAWPQVNSVCQFWGDLISSAEFLIWQCVYSITRHLVKTCSVQADAPSDSDPIIMG